MFDNLITRNIMLGRLEETFLKTKLTQFSFVRGYVSFLEFNVLGYVVLGSSP